MMHLSPVPTESKAQVKIAGYLSPAQGEERDDQKTNK